MTDNDSAFKAATSEYTSARCGLYSGEVGSAPAPAVPTSPRPPANHTYTRTT
jgi:hypothetical protein